MAEPQTRCASGQTAWLVHSTGSASTHWTSRPSPLTALRGIGSLRDPIRVRGTIEGALWGSVQAHKFLRDAVVLSDDAGRFNVGRHALCWGTRRTAGV